MKHFKMYSIVIILIALIPSLSFTKDDNVKFEVIKFEQNENSGKTVRIKTTNVSDKAIVSMLVQVILKDKDDDDISFELLFPVSKHDNPLLPNNSTLNEISISDEKNEGEKVSLKIKKIQFE